MWEMYSPLDDKSYKVYKCFQHKMFSSGTNVDKNEKEADSEKERGVTDCWNKKKIPRIHIV